MLGAGEVIENFSNTEFKGLIRTKSATYTWTMSDTLKCCESIWANYKSVPDLTGSVFKRINLEFHKPVPIGDNGSYLSYCFLQIWVDDKYYDITFNNQHNGYYSHNVILYINGKLLHKLSI